MMNDGEAEQCRTKLPFEVEEFLNQPYINREEDPLAMDVFKPVTEKGTELPVIVTIHGGGLVRGDRKISRKFNRILAGHGYLVFSVEYRLVPRANCAQQLDDVSAGMDLIGRALVDFDVDFARIFLIAESAGAYLATYVTAMRGNHALTER
ncbi:MAG: alpha/beta hydrolase [Lachnospiraceae bacterium]|nr:alpha/beta hydrolase [Lachnospiraceae bacterium]